MPPCRALDTRGLAHPCSSAAATTALTMPLWRKWCQRTGLVDDPGHRKIHHSPIPLAGGLAVLTGLIVPLLGAVVLLKLKLIRSTYADALIYGLNKREFQLIAIAVGCIALWIKLRG